MIGCEIKSPSDVLGTSHNLSGTTNKVPNDNKEYDGPVRTITFVSINDLHGNIQRDNNGANGLANTASAINKLSKYYGDDNDATNTTDDIVLFANGDMFQGTAISNKSYGRVVVEAMNAMNFDAMGIGNHEFDWGLDKILVYWDNVKSNGEATFPLLSANIVQKSTNKNLYDFSTSDEIEQFTIVEKEGVKVGLVSAIGPCEGSIIASAVADYKFENVTSSVNRAALKAKEAGAEMIVVSIHYGNTSGVQNYDANREIAELKDNDGNYLVDVIFNGHTHTAQKGVITRKDGTSVPVVQASSNNNAYGYVTMTYDTIGGVTDVKDYGLTYVSEAGKGYDYDVEAIIKSYESKLDVNSYLAISDVTIKKKADLYDYLGEILINSVGADYAISNTGGVRSVSDFKAGQEITESTIYEAIPFDNTIYFVTIKGFALYDFYVNSDGYYYFGKTSSVPDWSSLKGSNKEYTLSIIDYVYTSDYFTGKHRDYSKYVSSLVKTNIVFRDAFELDVKLFGDAGERWNPNKGTKITRESFSWQ